MIGDVAADVDGFLLAKAFVKLSTVAPCDPF
jgi:hypothetical protein